jgi:putative pyruvate formate lyase activating enzyme
MSNRDDSGKFFLSGKDFEPSYLELFRSGELKRRVDVSLKQLSNCNVCPRNCGVDRLNNEQATCKSGRYARVASYSPHLGEEDCLRGRRGSGTIFFSWCNLRCVFCQNSDISQSNAGIEVQAQHLSAMMLELQNCGCHNINFVTPEHVVPQMLEGLLLAVEQGLRLPIVYNTSAYDSIESLQMLDGIIDIYMPDIKFLDEKLSLRYLKAKDYPQAARAAFKEMQRQVGALKMDEDGLAKRGILVRHLVMPGHLDETRAIMRFLADEISPDTYINVMAQYYPSGKVSSDRYWEINRCLTADEYKEAVQSAHDAGLWRLDERRKMFPFG